MAYCELTCDAIEEPGTAVGLGVASVSSGAWTTAYFGAVAWVNDSRSWASMRRPLGTDSDRVWRASPSVMEASCTAVTSWNQSPNCLNGRMMLVDWL